MKPFKWRDLWGLFGLSLAVRLVVAVLVRRPGYMDVAYYAAGAVRLAQGGGLSEPFLWNYLDDPVALPRPGFLYWMPLPSLLAGPFAFLFPGSFFALQLPFVLISALIPLVAYRVAWEIAGQRRTAWLAALLALFNGFFFPYWNLPETFALFALWGSVALWLAGKWPSWRVSLLIGALVGLAHLTRADGVLLLPVVALASLISLRTHNVQRATRLVIGCWASIVLGYLIVMTPWFVRNLSVGGVLLSPASAKTLWLTDYDDLFCYSCDLSLRSYLAWGWHNILNSKLSALWINFQHLLAEDCMVFLLPFVLIGLYRLRRRATFVVSTIYLFLLYLVHSLVFTFPGWRGSFFHSSGVMLPFLFGAGVEGLEAAVRWAARRRRWRWPQARAVFTTAAIVAAVVLSGYVTGQKLTAWRDTDVLYEEVGRWLAREGLEDGAVMVANPPAFWYHTRYSAVVVPNDDVEVLLVVADRYDVRYVLLDRNRPAALAGLYTGEKPHPLLQPMAVWGEGENRAILYALE
jgi:4-amino-4-deoxy-L-arabinose transferase-like glycosyltransferase